jgi:hypothetical protein
VHKLQQQLLLLLLLLLIKSGKSSTGKTAKISGRKAAAAAASSSTTTKGKGKSRAKSSTATNSNTSSSSSSSGKLPVVACDEDEESHSVTAKQAERDAFLSHFHALGCSMLSAYCLKAAASVVALVQLQCVAKAETGAALGDNCYKLPLEFLPEDVLHRSSRSVDGAAAFLQVSMCVHSV